ncbi:MAG: hypothetical protein KAT54_06025, partial [Candidatus Marinimicrobia bacterium]|nr:hypothetical protein [Candidatus Neomarinimicrobiota bacterium]
LGSFKCDTIHQAIDITFLENEPHIYPGEGDIASGYTWRSHSVDKTGILDFLKLKLSVSEYCVAYAVTYICSPIEKNIKLLMGSDDCIGMWLNGNEILHKIIWRGVQPGEDVVPAHLSAGWNRLLVKVVNGHGGFALVGEIVELDNSIPTDLTFSTQKPESIASISASPFPYISGNRLGRSYLKDKTNQRIFPVEVTICNLGIEGKQNCELVVTCGKKQITRTKFNLEKLANISIPLNSDNVLQAISSGIHIKSFFNKKKYDEKFLQIEPEDVLKSIFTSEQLPADIMALRLLYHDLRENLYWFSYFTGKESSLKKESLMTCTRAALKEDWDTFQQIHKLDFKELTDFSKEIKKDTLHVIGQSHIDLAWLWRWPETIDICRRTNQSALNFFDEEPEYKYIQTSAQAFLWLEE